MERINEILSEVELNEGARTEIYTVPSKKRRGHIAKRLDDLLKSLEENDEEVIPHSQVVTINSIGKRTYIKKYDNGRIDIIRFPRNAEVHDFYEL